MVLASTFAALLLSQGPSPALKPEAGLAAVPAAQDLEQGQTPAERHPPLAPDLPLEERAPDGDGAFIWQMLRSLLALAAVIALIYLVFKVGLGKFLQGSFMRPGRYVTVLERVPLDARHALFVVELTGGRKLLLGSSERGISVLESVEPARPSELSFKDALEKAQAKDGTHV